MLKQFFKKYKKNTKIDTLWLYNLFRNQYKPASLIRERLDEQVREQRLSLAELEARRPTLAKLLANARDAALTPSNARIAKKLEQRAEDIYVRWDFLYYFLYYFL